MAERARERSDFVPHLPDLIVSTAECWRTIRDAQTEVDPFGPNYAALDEARATLETLAYQLTGQRGFFALAAVERCQGRHEPSLSDGEPF